MTQEEQFLRLLNVVERAVLETVRPPTVREAFLDALTGFLFRRWHHLGTESADEVFLGTLSLYAERAVRSAAEVMARVAEPLKLHVGVGEFRRLLDALEKPENRTLLVLFGELPDVDSERHLAEMLWLHEVALCFLETGSLDTALQQVKTPAQSLAAARRKFFRLASRVRRAVPRTELERLANQLDLLDGFVVHEVAVTGAVCRMLIALS